MRPAIIAGGAGNDTQRAGPARGPPTRVHLIPPCWAPVVASTEGTAGGRYCLWVIPAMGEDFMPYDPGCTPVSHTSQPHICLEGCEGQGPIPRPVHILQIQLQIYHFLE